MYAKVFGQIFDSSIADNYQLRHFFMDLLVLADCNGVVDMTLTAISARTRIPLEAVTNFIKLLESPDEQSRTADYNGRRIIKFDEHRSWGWVIVNYANFREIATDSERRERTKERVQRFKDKNAHLLVKQVSNGKSIQTEIPYVCASASGGLEGDARGRFQKPTLEAVKLHGIKIELPEIECEKFYDYYEANGWKVGRNPMKMWTAAMSNWKRNCKTYETSRRSSRQSPSRSEGTANEGVASQYAGITSVN